MIKNKKSVVYIVLILVLSLFVPFTFNKIKAYETTATLLDRCDRNGSLIHNGLSRKYLIHVPRSYDKGNTPVALVIVLHGGGGNGKGMVRITGFSEKADKEGFIVVYPDGTNVNGIAQDRLTWNACSCCGSALDNNIDDIGFIRALIEKLESEYRIDSKKIFATGFSNGAFLSYKLACELSDKLAAIAPVEGAFNCTSCNPAAPISLVIFHGTADQHVLYNGGEPRIQFDPHPRVDNPVSYAVSFWVDKNNCSTTSAREEQNKTIVKETYTGGTNNTEVVLYTIIGGGHAWTGGQPIRFLAKPTKALSATNAMWDFFKTHPKV